MITSICELTSETEAPDLINNYIVLFHITEITKDFNKNLKNIIIVFGVIISQCEKCHNICTCNLIKNIKICIQCKKQYSNY